MIAWLTLSAMVNADPGPRARAAVNVLDAKTYYGTVTSLGADYRTANRADLGLNVDLLDRNYRGGVGVHDSQFTPNLSLPFGERAYVDAAGSASSTASIYARWSASLAPHVVYDRTDYGLGFKYADYRLTHVGVFNPSAMHYFQNGVAVGFAANVVRTEEFISSLSTQVVYQPTEAHLLRGGAGIGRTLEDAGLTALFNVWSVEYAYTCVARFTAGLAYVDYWSQVRRERTIGFRLGWR